MKTLGINNENYKLLKYENIYVFRISYGKLNFTMTYSYIDSAYSHQGLIYGHIL